MEKKLHLSRPDKRLSGNERLLGEMMVTQLRAMGIEVVIDTAALRRVFKSAGEDKSTKGMTRFLYDSSYTVYAAEKNGKLYLDPRALDSETAISEYARLWTRAIRTADNDRWKEIVSSLQKDTATWEVCRRLSTHDAPDEIAEELICKFSGEQGKKRIEKEFQKLQKRGNASDSINYGNALKNIIRSIQEFWTALQQRMQKGVSLQKLGDTVLRDFAEKVNPYKKVEEALRKRDGEYLEAVRNKDRKTAIRLVNYALRENVGNGIVPYIQTARYKDVRALAHAVKKRDKKNIRKAARRLRPYVIQDAVLVPIPSHKGMATDTLDLARELAKMTGVPVVNALQGEERKSQYRAKREGYALSSAEIAMRLVTSLPHDKVPVLIDNVVNTGNTAKAAVEAVGGGVVLPLGVARYSKYGHAVGLRPIEILSEKPLSQQFRKNRNITRTKEITTMKQKPYREQATKPDFASDCLTMNIHGYTTAKGKHTTFRQLDLFDDRAKTVKLNTKPILGSREYKPSYEIMRDGLSATDNTILLFQQNKTVKAYYDDAIIVSGMFNIPLKDNAVEIEENKLNSFYPVLIKRGYKVAMADETLTEKLLQQIEKTGRIDMSALNSKEEKAVSPLDIRLRNITENEMCNVERVFTEDKSVSLFGGNDKIESSADVAYIFRALEDKAVEHSFFVLVSEGKPTVIHAGMGGPRGTLVDSTSLNVLIDTIKPDDVYFVHNHPSGNLTPSTEDRTLFSKFDSMVGERANAHGIIIDTYENKFSTFNENGKIEEEYQKEKSKGEEVKIYAFDKKVFSKDYKPDKFVTATAIAGHIAALRLGESKKIGFLAMDTNFSINGNLLLPVSDIKDIKRDTIQEIIRNTTLMGANQVVLYGSGANDTEYANVIAKNIQTLSGGNITMRDALSISQEGDYYSLHENGLLREESVPYNQVNPNDVKAIRKDIIDNIKKKGTSPRAVQYMEQLKDIEIIPRIGSAKGGQRIVGGSINGKAVPYAMATAEDTRSYDRMRKTLLKNGAARTLFEKTFAPMLADIIIKKIRPDLAREEEQVKKCQHSR